SLPLGFAAAGWAAACVGAAAAVGWAAGGAAGACVALGAGGAPGPHAVRTATTIMATRLRADCGMTLPLRRELGHVRRWGRVSPRGPANGARRSGQSGGSGPGTSHVAWHH